MTGAVYIISCYFGNKEIEIHPAPLCRNCIFFSNNREYVEQARKKGWIFEYVAKLISNDSLVCSIQSKYIKFLIFLNDFERYRNFSNILYFDHNLEVLETHVIHMMDSISGKSICIRQHENLSRISVWDEIWEARAQERYKKSMDKTVVFIRKMGENMDFGKVCNTGLILYRNDERILPFLNEVYESCIILEQPCCQIFWSVFSPKYADLIHTFPFREIYPRNLAWEKLGYFP